jgi:DNA-binding SARP family transcriptional activator
LAEATARQLAEIGPDGESRALASGFIGLVGVSVDAHLPSVISDFERLRRLQVARGDSHFAATTLLNMALIHKVQGNAIEVLSVLDAAFPFAGSDPHSTVHASIRTARAWALAHLGDVAAARRTIQEAIQDVDILGRAEPLLEACELEIWYGSEGRAAELLAQAEPASAESPTLEPLYLICAAQLAVRRRDIDGAMTLASRFEIGKPSVVMGAMAQQLSIAAQVAMLRKDPRSKDAMDRATRHAVAQAATYWTQLNRVWVETEPGSAGLNLLIRRLGEEAPAFLSVAAERIVDRLDTVGETELGIVQMEIAARPDRWLPSLRGAVDQGGDAAIVASRLLDVVGEGEDVLRLRRFSRGSKPRVDPMLGRELARRLADRVQIEDQGRVAIQIGDRSVEGTSIRRKVLTLLCYLITRSRFAATRDEVLDTLWPDFEPAVALNSLNQTLYFLRRVFEPAYREDTSPGYVHHESDVIWLDRQLVSSRSQVCADFVRTLGPNPSPEDVRRLISMYRGQFALDFAYEEWAVAYRDTLHASYLQVIENAVAGDMATGHWERGIVTARSALSIDPQAEHLEASLVRLLRLSGAHAAAAEQYAHYSVVLREGLGIEPPPLDAL